MLTRKPFLLLHRNQCKGQIFRADLLRVFAKGVGMAVVLQDNVRHRKAFRACASRSRSAGRSAFPAIMSPSFAGEPPYDDDHVGKGDPEVDDLAPALGTPQELLVWWQLWALLDVLFEKNLGLFPSDLRGRPGPLVGLSDFPWG